MKPAAQAAQSVEGAPTGPDVPLPSYFNTEQESVRADSLEQAQLNALEVVLPDLEKRPPEVAVSYYNCWSCGRPGHFRRDCPERYGVGGASASSSSGPEVVRAEPDTEQLGTLLAVQAVTLAARQIAAFL